MSIPPEIIKTDQTSVTRIFTEKKACMLFSLIAVKEIISLFIHSLICFLLKSQPRIKD